MPGTITSHDERTARAVDAAHAPRDRPSVIVAHAGKQHAYRHALAVQRAGALRRFATSGYYKPDRWPDSLAGGSARFDAWLRRRYLSGLDSARVVRRWRLELPELLARRLCGNGTLADNLVFRRDASFDRWVARRFAGSADIYWGFQGSCLDSLSAARRAGKIAVAEFATAHVTLAHELLTAEAERHPEWSDSISNLHFPDWYLRRLEREPHEADVSIAASSFTRQSLLAAGVPAERIEMLPLGADLEQFTSSVRSADGPFRILFVGGVGQRKGIKYLLEAYRRMRSENTELVLVGPLAGSGAALAGYQGLFTYLGRLDQRAVVDQMRRAHVLVLPSVFEGFGLVIPEAMATGMPVIASTHSAGPEIIREGQDGFVLRPDDVEGLADKLAWLADHRRDAVEMGGQAAERAQAFSWRRHQARVAELIDHIWRTQRGTIVEESAGEKTAR